MTAQKPILLNPDSKLLELCIGPTDIGNKALTQAKVEKLWINDRVKLLNCVKKHKALADFTVNQVKLLGGK